MSVVSETDQFTAEILRSYLVSTVREMVGTTTRTAYSTCFAHGEDFTCALFDENGSMIAQDQGVPVHAGGLEDAVKHIIAIAGTVREGDVFVHNDPYSGGTHQADGLICRPIFVEDRLLGFSANRGHWTDIGGMAPGGWSGAATEVLQEGLRIPGVRLISEGTVDENVRSLILSNVRLPRQLWGDIQSQVASNIVAERRIRTLVERNGFNGFAAAVDAALSYSRRRFLVALEAIGEGTAEASDFLEDDGHGNGPFTIRVRLTKRPDGLDVDFTGTDSQAGAPINCTLACTKAGAVASVVAVCDPEIPLNAGLTKLVNVIAPPGTLVNPQYPAPAFGTTADPVTRVSETVLRAFSVLIPERVPAGSYATGNNVTASGIDRDGEGFLWYSYQSGGCGARPGKDGNSAEWHLMGNSKNESMEVWETRYPVQFLGYRLIDDSGGVGEWRGGLGTERLFRLLVDTKLSAISDHHRVGAHGVAGGADGLPNGFAVEREGVRVSLQELFDLPSPSKVFNLQLRAGDVFVSIQGGGGGYGDPENRGGDLVSRDLREGYVSQGSNSSAAGSSP